MNIAEIMIAIEQLSPREQEEVFAILARRLIARRDPTVRPLVEKRLSFDEACDVVFRENRELSGLMAK